MDHEDTAQGSNAPTMALRSVIASVREAAIATGLSERTLYRAMARGDFVPRVRLSARRFGFRVVDVLAWVDARREAGGASAAPPRR